MEVSIGSALVSRGLLLALIFFCWPLLDLPLSPRTGPTPPRLDRLASKVLPKSTLSSRPRREIDRRLFLAQFERQAGDTLLPCLRQSVAAKGSLLFMARLNIQGHLTAVRVLDAQASGSACVRPALEAMTFKSLGLTHDSLEISWRMDW